MKKIIAISILLGSMASAASPSKFAIGPKISTPGVGAEFRLKLNELCALRTGINFFSLSRTFSSNNADWKGKARLLNVPVILDIHAFKNDFAFSVGAFYNGNRLDLSVEPSRNITLNGHTYTPAQVGKITGDLTFRKISSYVGIRYDNSYTTEKGFSFNADLGVLFQGSSKAKIKSITGMLRNYQQLIEDAAKDAQTKVNTGYVRFHPVVSLGFKYNF
jgi:hypothetical protein